jgi:hypothetical protein
MDILSRRFAKSGDGAPIDAPVWERVNVKIAVLMTQKKSSTLTIYFPLSIRKKASRVGTVILRDYLPEQGYSPSVIRVIGSNLKKKIV